MADTIIITSAGRAALVNAQNNGTNAVLISAIGLTASAVVPTPAVTNLTGEFKRINTLSGTAVAPDLIHLTVMDESTETYSVRSYALYLADGTLFAIYGQPAVIVEKSQNSTLLLAIDIKFADVSAAQIAFGNTNFLMPPATEDIQGVIEIATQPEANGGTDDQRALTPKKARSALMAWLLAQDGAGSGLDADLLDGQDSSAFLQASLFTGAEVLSRLLSHDGAGSGLDADLLDGQHANAFLQASLFTGAQIMSRLLAVDGAGSGLDADLLDGQDSSYFTNIAARLGFNPLNAAHYTAADVLAKVLSVDGAGSGLDADLLDGQDSSYFTNIVARLGFSPLNAAHYTAADVLAKVLSVDGAGSGVDADLLDGQHASAFIAASAMLGGNQSLAQSGYQRLPGGLIIQWGRGASQISSDLSSHGQIVTFPIAFPNAVFTCVVGTDVGNPTNIDAIYQLHSLTNTNVRFFNNLFITHETGYARPFWIAFGN